LVLTLTHALRYKKFIATLLYVRVFRKIVFFEKVRNNIITRLMMKTYLKLALYTLALCQTMLVAIPAANAAPPGPLDLAQSPLFYGLQQKPIVMLNLTKDNQLHFKAYTDYSDLDDDGKPDLTYKHSFNYYGYWDSQKCYEYRAADGGYFAPIRFSADKYCEGTYWSGNFLNWVATSRMDSVRKILYGGKRSTDSVTETMLERNFLPMDAHSWAKFYDGSDLNKLVPTSIIGTLSATASGKVYTDNTGVTLRNTRIAGAGDYFINSTISARVGDQIKLTQAVADVIRYGRITAINGTLLTINIPNATVGVLGSTANSVRTSEWNLENLSATGVTFCNTTLVGNGNSTTAVAPPLIRVARGNTELWGANERWQCGFQGEKASSSGGGFTAGGQNGNYFPLSGLKSNAESPPNNTTYKVADYTARILACVDQSNAATDPQEVWAKREGCRAYGSQWKPIGLLQKQDGFKFGLFTGSYAKNISGGVLRSNVGDFSLEVDVNGRFVNPATSTALTAKGSIVKAIDAIRMTGYSYNDGTYIGFDGDCTFQLIDLVPTGASGNIRNQGACSSWGNPIAEMYTESLRYLAGAGADATSTYTESGSVDAALGLKIITWQDPITTNNYCVPLKNIVFNAATTSYDGDQVNMAGLSGAGTAASYTNTIGSYEGIASGIAGKLDGAASGSAGFNSCTNKTGTLSQLRGVCPEGAPYSGSYLTSGSAYFARNNRIRATPAIPASAASLFPNAYTVETFGVSLANNTPKIDLFSKDGKSILGTITPAYYLDKGDGIGGGTIVDFKIVEAPDFTQDTVKGVYYINWEDSGFGGDFDQDVIGRIEFSLNRSTGVLSVTTAATNASTANPQGFGYVLSGTNIDGPHFHSGILTFNYTNPVSNVVECTNCEAGQSPTTQTYTLSGTAGTSLKDPLYYAAKWGAIKDPGSAAIAAFDKRGKKDSLGNDVPDGIPDNYFNVSNPAKLAEQLEALFVAIAQGSSSSSAAASTTRASSDTLAFTASFNGEKWGGALKAFSVDAGTTVTFTEEWDAPTLLNTRASARKLFTTNSSSRSGAAFEWSNLSTAQQALLVSEDVQKFIAGDRSNEGTTASNFRVRAPSVLGDIINSNPAFSSDKPEFSAAFGALPGYADFTKEFDSRPSQGGTKRNRAIFVGANDGMLHAFVGDSKTKDGGTELFAYVPSMIYDKLPLLTQQDYNATGNHKYSVDGSPFVSDANIATASAPDWKTILLSGLGAGGAGFFALDVTRPESFDASKVLWEFTATDANRTIGAVVKSDLGASTPQPRIARTNVAGESWFAMFGNGYNSIQTPTHGQAVLFAAKLGKSTVGWSEGSDFYRLVLSTEIDNGLSTPTLVDYDRDGFVDVIYAGDLKGNLWRINVKDATPATWSGKKLFTSQTGQPITTAPQVTRHPNGGFIIIVGTGKYLETSDVNIVPPVQSLYGIIDLDPFSTTVTTQTISTQNPVTITNRTLPIAGVTDGQCVTDKGWYANLRNGSTLDGERNVFDSALVAGSLFTPTLIPSGDLCLGGGKSYLYCINPFTGCACDPTAAAATESAGIQSTPRFIAVSPAPIGRNDTTGGGRTIEVDASGRQTTGLRVIKLGNAEGTPVSLGGGLSTLPTPSGRQSWREIVDLQ
jgi:type IV pilus assembly protein PilY1